MWSNDSTVGERPVMFDDPGATARNSAVWFVVPIVRDRSKLDMRGEGRDVDGSWFVVAIPPISWKMPMVCR